jgi:hypothetical protein
MMKTTFSSIKDRGKALMLALMTLFSIAASAQFSLNTVPPLNGGNGSNGVTFNLTAGQTILLDSILVTASAGSFDVWYTTTPISGPPTINAASGWTQIGTGLTVSSGVTDGSITPLPANFGLLIPAGQTYGFFVGGGSLRYTTGTAGVSAPFTDGVATIETGNLVGYGGGAPNPTFHPRQFNGGIRYSILGGANDAAVLSVDSPTVFCAGMEDIYATIANFGSNQLDSVMVNWEFNGVAQTPINYTTLIDTLNSPSGNTASLFLGTKMFASGVPNTIKVWTSMPNGVADTSNFNDTITSVKAASLAGGTYTINANLAPSATNYISFADFSNAVSQFGICGNVTVDVASGSGPYIEQLNFNGFSGASNRRITINGNNEIISFASNNTNERAVVSIQNSSFISIDSLIIDATGGSHGYGVFLNNSDDISITNSFINVDVSSTSSNYTGVMVSGSMTSAFTTTTFNNFTFTGNTVIGGYYGIVTAGDLSNKSVNTVIEDNTFSDWYFYGARHSNTDGLSFQRNDISRPGRTASSTTYGFYSAGNESMIVNRNSIHNLFDGITTSTSSCYPIYNSNDVPVGKEAVIMNNLVYNINHNGTIYGIYDLGSDNNLYYNNIVSLDNTSATAGTTRGYYQSSASSGSEFRNNIISITRGGTGTKHGIYLNGAPSASTNNNVFIGSTSGTNHYGYAGGNQTTLADFQNAGFGTNDVEGDPNFTDITLDDYQPLNLSLNAAGFPAPQVVEDFNGDARVVSANDIGAFKIASPALDVAASSIDIATPFCAGNENVSVTVSNNGTSQINSLTIDWSIDGIAQTPINYTSLIDTIGSVAGNSVQILLTNYAFAANTPVTFQAIVSGANGTTVPDAFPGNDTTALTAGASISGTFTLDPNLSPSATNFVSFSDASVALSTFGVCGPVTINVAQGAYIESLNLSNVVGTSAINTITIDGGDSSATLLSHDGTTDFGAVSISGTDYVTIKNMSIDYTGATGAAVITANANHISIENSILTVDTTSTSFNLYGVSLSSSITSNSTGAVSDYFNLSNSIVKGGYYGIRAYGSNGNSVKGINIVNNTFEQTWYYGVYLYYTDSVFIVNNNIDIEERGNTFADGVYAFYTNNFDFSRNTVRAIDYGAYFFNSGQPFANTMRNVISNNMIYSSTDYALYLYYIDSADIFHNTIASDASNIPAVQLYNAGANSVSGYDMRNNIFYSNGSFALRTNVVDTIMFATQDYNNYYTSGTDLLSINSTVYANLGGYTTANPAFNANSLEGDPQFLNYPLDFHVLGGLVNDMGDNTVGISIDIDGDARPASGSTVVDMGADEFTPPSCTPPTAVNFTNITITSADVTFVGGVGSTWEYEIGPVGFTQGTGTLDTAATPTVSLTGLASGTTYDIYVRELCSPTSASPIVGPYAFGTAFSIPLNEDFETFTVGNAGSTFNNGWTNTGTSRPNWEVEDASGSNENSSATGPFFDATFPAVAGGKYMYLETSGGSLGDQNVLSSPPVFVPTTANALTLEFDYHMFGATMGELYVVVDTNNVSDTVVTLVGQQQAAQGDPFLTSTTPLTGYAGKSITLRFIGVRGSSFTGDISIDEVALFEPSNQEIGITAMTAPVTQCGLTSTEPVTIDITNFGLAAATGFTANLIVDGGATITETVTASIAPGSTFSYTFTATANLSAPGAHTVDAYVVLAGDPVQTNDSIFKSVTSIPLVSSFPYAESFETGNGGWTANGTTSFAVGVPGGSTIDTASDGTQAWVTNLAGAYNPNEAGWIQSPCMDMSTVGIPILEFDVWWNSENSWDGAVLQYSLDGGASWTKLGAFGDPGNWYTDNSVNGLANLEPSQEGWTGTPGSGSWLPVRRVVDTLAGQSSVLFRFAFGSDGSVQNGDGFGMDNFRLYDSIQTNIQIDSMITLLSDCGLNANEDITVSLTNAGSTPYINTPITYIINGGTPVTETITDTILGGTSYVYTFNTQANFSVAGGYALDVYVSQTPADSIPSNDSISVNIIRSPSTSIDSTTATVLYDFEANNGDFSTYGANSSWAYGSPNTFYINSARSGSNAWVTGLTSSHNSNELSYLETQCFDMSGFPSTEPLFMSFYTIYQTEISADQIWMEYSTNNGGSWSKVMPSSSSINFYNNTTDNVWEGFSSGGVGTWIPVLNDIVGLGGNSKVKFRFVFSSNGSLVNDGFGIDDFQINLAVGEKELFNGSSSLSLQPNPTRDLVNISFGNYAKGDYQVDVVNINGQTLRSNVLSVGSDFETKTIDLNGIEAGVYFVRVINGETITTEKLIVR